MIYVTHDQIEAMTLADRIVVLRESRIQQIGSPGEIYRRPANLFVAGFVGSPQMNFVKGQHRGERAGAGLRRRRAIIFRSRLTISRAVPNPDRTSCSASGRSTRDRQAGTSAAGLWPGFTIDIVEPMGADTVIWCSDGDRDASGPHGGTRKATPGDRLALGLDPSQVSLFAQDTGDRL